MLCHWLDLFSFGSWGDGKYNWCKLISMAFNLVRVCIERSTAHELDTLFTQGDTACACSVNCHCCENPRTLLFLGKSKISTSKTTISLHRDIVFWYRNTNAVVSQCEKTNTFWMVSHLHWGNIDSLNDRQRFKCSLSQFLLTKGHQ